MSSRVARKPIVLPAGVEAKLQYSQVSIKGSKGELKHVVHAAVKVSIENKTISISANAGFENADAIAGTTRAILNNHVTGVTEGFKKKLQLVGVGYRAQVGKAKDGRHTLNLTLGLSHPVIYVAPKGIEIVSPAVTDIEVSGL